MLFELDENIKVSRVAYINNKIYASSNDFVQGNYSYYYEGGLYTTSDNGLSWQKIGRFQIGSPGPGEIKSNPYSPNEIFITTMAGIYKGVDTLTSVEIINHVPESPVLFQNYPNPFNPTTTIEFNIPQREKVLIEVFDVLGQKVKTLLNTEIEKRKHKINFNATGLPSGIYFYRFNTGSNSITKKMVYLR